MNQKILVAGDPSLGVVKYKGRNCVFAHETALKHFTANPEKFFVGARDMYILI